MTLDPLRPFLAGAATGVGALLVWSALVCSLPESAPPAVVPPATRPFGGWLRLDGASALLVRGLRIPDGPFTVECWARCDDPSGTQSVLGNTLRDGGFEFTWRDANSRRGAASPTAWVRTERTLTSTRPGWTAVPSAEPPGAGGWTHLALTCDGTRLRLFVGGRLAGDRALLGAVVPSRAPLFVGADASNDDAEVPADFLRGAVAEVRISRGVRYEGPFRPASRFAPDADTVLLLPFDDVTAPWRDLSPAPHDVRGIGRPAVQFSE